MSTDDADEHPEPTAIASYRTEGEAEIAQAKLRAYGIEAALDDQIEGVVPVEGEGGVVLEVRAQDAADATAILAEEPIPPPEPPDAPTDE